MSKNKFAAVIGFGLVFIGIICTSWSVYRIQSGAAKVEAYVGQITEQLKVEDRAGSRKSEFEIITENSAVLDLEPEPEVIPKPDSKAEPNPGPAQAPVSFPPSNQPETARAKAQTTSQQVQRSSGELEVLYPTRPQIGDAIGTLTIPKLNQTLPIFHGADEKVLEKGIGHYAHSVLPGEADNAVLSGHRDTVFRQLGKVTKGDRFIVNTSAGTFTYQVRETRIVEADDKTVIVPASGPVLTVTTCYPFNYVGDAPQRYILISDLMD